MALTSWDKLLIFLSGSGVVVVAVIIVACFAGPGCWGFNYLIKRENKKKMLEEVLGSRSSSTKSTSSLHDCEYAGEFWTNNQNLMIFGTEFFYSEEKKPSKAKEIVPFNAKDSVFNVKCSSLLASRPLYSKAQNGNPKLKIKLVYTGLTNDELMGRLAVHVMSASFLPCREYVSTVDPYVYLEIFTNKWSFLKSKNVHSVQTRVVKSDSNPRFDEIFTFDGFKREIQNWCLKFTIFDQDRLTRITPLLEKKLYIGELKDLVPGRSLSLDLSLHKAVKNVGNLFFGISYLPTSQRFNINVIKAAKLKYQTHVSSLVEFYPFVRVIMLNSNGKCIKKRKTHFRQGEFSPTFNQSFIFDISIANLEQTIFLILLCTKTMQKLRHSEDATSSDGDQEWVTGDRKDKVLGKIVLGRNVKCTRARQHWVSVMENPRKMISLWHELR